MELDADGACLCGGRFRPAFGTSRSGLVAEAVNGMEGKEAIFIYQDKPMGIAVSGDKVGQVLGGGGGVDEYPIDLLGLQDLFQGGKASEYALANKAVLRGNMLGNPVGDCGCIRENNA